MQPDSIADLRIINDDEAAKQAGVSKATWLRIVRRGDGPPRVQISARRGGTTVRDYRRWLDARRA